MKIPPVRCFDAILSNFTVLSYGLQVKFKKDELHRLPEFDDVVKPDVASMSASTSSTRPVYSNQDHANIVTPTRQPMQQNQTKPLSSIPAHVRSEISSLGSTSISSTSNAIQVAVKGPVHPMGLNTPITPRHHPPQRPNLNPPQHQHQPDRRVSFADHQQKLATKPPSTAATMNPEPIRSSTDFEAEESFGFNSDDDALFALADLGPPIDADSADTGRPIDSDEGRPINSNEGLLGSADDTMIGDDVFDQQHEKKTEPSGVGVVSAPKLSRRELIAAALVSVEDKVDTTSDSDLLKGRGHGNERQASGSGNISNETTSGTGTGTSNTHDKMSLQANAGSKASSSTSSLGVRSSIPPQQQQQNLNHNPGLNLTSLVQQRYKRHVVQRQNQNENPNQIGLSSSSVKDESKRASTPSIGGFHFPPGIVCPCSFYCRGLF
jgi:DNA repair and recombination protein RAD52